MSLDCHGMLVAMTDCSHWFNKNDRHLATPPHSQLRLCTITMFLNVVVLITVTVVRLIYHLLSDGPKLKKKKKPIVESLVPSTSVGLICTTHVMLSWTHSATIKKSNWNEPWPLNYTSITGFRTGWKNKFDHVVSPSTQPRHVHASIKEICQGIFGKTWGTDSIRGKEKDIWLGCHLSFTPCRTAFV